MTKLLSPNDLVELTGLHLDTIYGCIKRGLFPGAVKLAGRWRIPREDYEAWIAGEGVERRPSPSYRARTKVTTLADWRALRPDKEESCA